MSKERLTERTKEGIWVKEDYGENVMKMLYQCYGAEPLSHYANCDEGYCAMEKLAEYETLEEQGLLLRLPCKVGDKAWYVHKGGIDEVEVDSFALNVNLFVNVSLYIGCDRFGKTLTPYKTLFFTKSEAEEKLRELEGK